MNRIRRICRIRRFAAVLAGLAVAWLGLAAGTPAAFARISPPSAGMDSAAASAGSGTVSPPVTVTRTVVVGGMPGWQIALIAIGAALVAAASAVLTYRALAMHRQAAAATS